MKPPVLVASLVSVALLSSCYRPSDEFLSRAGRDPSPPNPHPSPSQPGTGHPTTPERVAAAISDLGGADLLEADVRKLFEKQGLKALPTLEAALLANPDDAGTLLRGAFAGLGNATELCQETLLYLTVHHPDLAEPLAHAASQINPETTSFLR
ncbi:hypothetical protein BH23VER1_BH23VER1_25610 [soil metagenome]